MKRYGFLLVLCAGLYGAGRLLGPVLPGGAGWFVRCYFSDVLAGVVLPAVTCLLLMAAGRPPLRRWYAVALLLLGAGLVWECLAPLWKPGAVFDWWDFAAYQLGGLLFRLVSCGKIPQKENGDQ